MLFVFLSHRVYFESIFLIQKKVQLSLLVCILSYFSPPGVSAALHEFAPGARNVGLANATVAYPSFWSIAGNQAGLAYQQHTQAGIFFQNHFMMKELALQGIAFALPTKPGTFGVNLSYFGYSLYNEKKAALAFARSFHSFFSFSVQIDYYHVHIADHYGNNGQLGIELGMMIKPLENLNIGMHLVNPARTKIASSPDEYIPSVFRMGLAYKISDRFLWLVETEKQLEYRLRVKTAFEMQHADRIFLRAGYDSGPSKLCFGLGYYVKKIQFDMAAAYQQPLGFSPYISISYVFSK